MKIKSIKLKDFKRFTDLTIKEIPETAKLMVMIGPNGCGKSSALEGMQFLRRARGFHGFSGTTDYYSKSDTQNLHDFNRLIDNIDIEFHGKSLSSQDDWKKGFQVRSSYRNDPTVESNQPHPSALNYQEQKQHRMTENDASVMANYGWLQSQWAEMSSHIEGSEETGKSLQDKVFGRLRDAVGRLFNNPKLVLMGLGNLYERQIFQFKKGASREFSYLNLSSGEKAVLDLLLDLIVAKDKFDDTVFAIDEPEAHIHTKFQGPLLEELYNLIPDNSQLWIATHSVGMVRQAQDLWRNDQDSVVFLDFGKDDSGQDRNFDDKVEITPAKPGPNLWGQTYDVALGDFSELIASEHYVFCEGEDFDEECYQHIFMERFPVTRFISIGGRNNVVNAVSKLKGKIAKAAKVSGIIDKDRATEQEVEEAAKKEVRTLSRKSIESYLFDDEVLTKLCKHSDKPDEAQNLLTVKNESLKKRTSEGKSKSPDDLKPIAQDIHVAAQNALKSVNLGNSKESFMRDILAPLIQSGMKVYEELHEDIFGE